MTALSMQRVERAVAAIALEGGAVAGARMVVREACAMFGGSHAVLAFYDAAGDLESVTRYSVGLTHDDLPMLAPEEQFVARAYATGRPVSHAPDAALGYPALAVPCGLGDRIVGALGVVFSTLDHLADSDEIAALSLFGAAAAAVIENARLTEHIQEAIRTPQDISEHWLRAVETAPSDLVLVVSREGRVLDANRVACRALGYTRHELVHRSIADLVPSPAGRQDHALLEALLARMAAGEVTNLESAFVTKSGRVFPVEVHVKPVEVDGQPVFIGIHRDISERKRAETQLVQTERLRALGEMAAGVIHDINNMLTAALGPLEVVLTASHDPLVQRVLLPAQRALRDGVQTVQRIQAFARQNTGASYAPVNLLALGYEVIELTRPRWQTQARQQGIDIAVDLRGAGVQLVLGNAAELREVMLNLVGNAVDAMPAGGRITIDVEDSGPNVTLRVGDTGMGMPLEVQQRVFDPFFTTKGDRGSGLGLSVVYGIISRHRGQITVGSAPGEGTTFTIVLPAAPSAAGARPDEAAVDLEPPAAQAPRVEHAPAVMAARPLRVLVIDDQADVAAVLQLILELDEHAVATYGTGADALASLDDEPFDLVCTDLNMAGMSGWDVAGAIKARRPGLPVALITGWGETFCLDELRRRGVDFLLRKPYQVSDVRSLIEQVRERIAAEHSSSSA